jgi:hypothetical protein
MKKIFILIILFAFSVLCFGQADTNFRLDKRKNQDLKKYTYVTNARSVVVKSDTAAAGDVMARFIYALNLSSFSIPDTNYRLDKRKTFDLKKYTHLLNANKKAFKIDTALAGEIMIEMVYLMNPDTVRILNRFDTNYIHKRIDSLKEKSIEVGDYREGDVIVSNGSEFKPLGIDSLISTYTGLKTITDLQSFGTNGDDTIRLTTNYFIRVLNTDATNGFISLPSSAPYGTEYTIIAHGNGESIGSINIIYGNGGENAYFYTYTSVVNMTLNTNYIYVFKRYFTDDVNGPGYILINKSRVSE